MFENLMGNSEKRQEKAELAAEARQMNYGREQNVLANAADDQTYNFMQNDKADLLRWQQELDDELIKLINTLKGQMVIEDRVIKIGEPLCNDFFINEIIIPQCSAFLNRNIINTNYSERIILDSLKNTMNDIDDVMADNYDRYDIEFTKFNVIHRNIVNVIKPGAYRAINGWTKKTDSTMSRHNFIEAVNNNNLEKNNKKWGLFGG